MLTLKIYESGLEAGLVPEMTKIIVSAKESTDRTNGKAAEGRMVLDSTLGVILAGKMSYEFASCEERMWRKDSEHGRE